MTELIAPSGCVHWIGTGLSTGSGLRLVCAASATVLWGRTKQKAQDCLSRLGLTDQAEPRAFDTATLGNEIAAGDIVVSMLPASWHTSLLQLAVDNSAHFVCSSYVSAEMAAYADNAQKSGLVILTEAGLDPGIDHILAHDLVRRAVAVAGDKPTTARFTSYCGSNPAVPNDFRYRFSWAPRGVLTALLTPARYIDEGSEKTAKRPWEALKQITVADEVFEVYPNRDSLPFIETYDFPASWKLETFVRGTLRLDGWSDAWAPVFAELVQGNDERITALADDLAARYPSRPSDRNRVVMSVELQITTETGRDWTGKYVMDVVSDDQESATPRLVSTALACGIREVLGSHVKPGLHQAVDGLESVQRWLRFLSNQGIHSDFVGDDKH